MMNFVRNLIRRIDVFALGPSALLYFLVFFYMVPAVALFGFDLTHTLAGFEFSWETIGIVSIGVVAMLLGYRVVGKFFPKRVSFSAGSGWNMARASVAFWIIFSGGIVAKLIRLTVGGYSHGGASQLAVPVALHSAAGFLEWFGLIAIAIGFTGYYSLRKKGRPFRMWRLYAWGSLIVQIAYAIPTCSRAKIAGPLIVFLIVHSYLVRFDIRRFVAVGALLLITIPAGVICRVPGVLDAYKVVDGFGNPNLRMSSLTTFAGESALSRMNHMTLVSKIVEADIPRWGGRSLRDLLVGLGPPRFLWHDKPVIGGYGNEFGREIGVIAPDNLTTSIGPTLPGEWYISFGVRGVVVGMFVIGGLWKALYMLFIGKRNPSLSGVVIYSIVWVQVVGGIESFIAPVYAGLVKLLIVLFLVHWFVKEKSLP